MSAPSRDDGRNAVAVVVPALDEAGNVGSLVRSVRDQEIGWVIVVDNGSIDGTADAASAAGAEVVVEPRRGYGYACAMGSRVAIGRGAEVVVYIDADHSSRPDEITALVEPILDDRADLVLGSRVLGRTEPGAMPAHQRFGNRVAAALMRPLCGVTLTDLGPFRAIRADTLRGLAMTEMTFGWPTEMTVECARSAARIVEVPVTWQARHAGRSKVGGTVRGSILASYRILAVIWRRARYRGAAATR